MFRLVIDLEMCIVPKDYQGKFKHGLEIIQIGAVLLDENFKQTDSFSQFVHPEFGVIETYIENLTGIHARDIKNAPLLKDALREFVEWIGDRPYQVYAWSESDRSQILYEVENKEIDDDKLRDFLRTDHWIDYQAVFQKRFGLEKQPSLSDALTWIDLDAEGHLHDGLVDAINTGRLMEKVEKNPNLELAKYELPEESIGTSLADALKGWNL